jgi:hypothetical protein
MMSSARRLSAWVSLLIFVASCAIPLLNAHELDVDCAASAPALAASSEDAQLRSHHQTPPTDFHCVLCHWLHAVSGLQAGSTLSANVLLLPAPVAGLCAESSLGLLPRCDGPLRAPPAFTS